MAHLISTILLLSGLMSTSQATGQEMEVQQNGQQDHQTSQSRISSCGDTQKTSTHAHKCMCACACTHKRETQELAITKEFQGTSMEICENACKSIQRQYELFINYEGCPFFSP